MFLNYNLCFIEENYDVQRLCEILFFSAYNVYHYKDVNSFENSYNIPVINHQCRSMTELLKLEFHPAEKRDTFEFGINVQRYFIVIGST